MESCSAIICNPPVASGKTRATDGPDFQVGCWLAQPRRNLIGQGEAVRHLARARADDVFSYGGVRVHPLVIATAMVKTPRVVEYQVRQTERGVDVAVVADGPFDRVRIVAAIEGGSVRQACRMRRQPSGRWTRYRDIRRRGKAGGSSPWTVVPELQPGLS